MLVSPLDMLNLQRVSCSARLSKLPRKLPIHSFALYSEAHARRQSLRNALCNCLRHKVGRYCDGVHSCKTALFDGSSVSPGHDAPHARRLALHPSTPPLGQPLRMRKQEHQVERLSTALVLPAGPLGGALKIACAVCCRPVAAARATPEASSLSHVRYASARFALQA